MIKKISDYNVFFINLDRRNDKRKFMEDQFTKYSINATRMSAVDAQNLPEAVKDYYMEDFVVRWNTKIERKLGRIACYLSHKIVLEMALERNLDNVLIMEDDCIILSDRIMELPIDSDILYLGGLLWGDQSYSQMLWKSIIGYKVAGAFAYLIIGKEKIKYVYDKLMECRSRTWDILLINQIQKLGNCYISNPPLCLPNLHFDSDVTFIGGKPKLYGNRYK